MQTVRLPVIEQEVAFWDFMEILFEELRCEMFYTKERKPAVAVASSAAAGSKAKKRHLSDSPDCADNSESTVKLSPDSEKKRRRLQVSLKRLDAATTAAATSAGGTSSSSKKSRLGLNKERKIGENTSSSSSSTSPVHSPSHSLSPASSTASSR